MTHTPVLYVGERNYSSWSLRPYLTLAWSGLAFEDRLVSLDQPGYGTGEIAAILALSPSGRVPVLHVDGQVIWDSLAISEWAAERAPTLWPAEPADRARARSLTCEMHAGFAAVRRDLSMNIRRRCAPTTPWPDDTARDLTRIREIFGGARGPYMFGARSITDAFFTPVATRLRTYGVALEGAAAHYASTLLADEAFLRWERQALADWRAPFGRAALDAMYPGTDR